MNTRSATGWQRKLAARIFRLSKVWYGGAEPTGEIISNQQREAIQNLDELPFVSEVYKRFLHTPDYFYGHSLWPLVVFDTSRGWPVSLLVLRLSADFQRAQNALSLGDECGRRI